ncbi:hypothetical protein CPB84DRAFT_1761660 [Gymnopilus junonius]|uniref:Uncharacterized protein n=1 Tax=Gymnopilus junonius TaxID=109634 RepID=A0A9P5P1F4_GYMJU|nr:hypothetical protein CPB84DRAFT_1761660 [Gymnopilus junonius]
MKAMMNRANKGERVTRREISHCLLRRAIGHGTGSRTRLDQKRVLLHCPPFL